MELIKPSYEILECPGNVLERIERAARTCYKSEDRIEPGSARKLVQLLVDRPHGAMLEFGGMITVRFISNRGFTHEMVRHRLGSFAQEALPIGLKAEIVVAANTREWMWIFKMRCDKTAHPRMLELMVPLREELRTRVPVLFDGDADA